MPQLSTGNVFLGLVAISATFFSFIVLATVRADVSDVRKPTEKEIAVCETEGRGRAVLVGGVVVHCTGDPTNYRG